MFGLRKTITTLTFWDKKNVFFLISKFEKYNILKNHNYNFDITIIAT